MKAMYQLNLATREFALFVATSQKAEVIQPTPQSMSLIMILKIFWWNACDHQMLINEQSDAFNSSANLVYIFSKFVKK